MVNIFLSSLLIILGGLMTIFGVVGLVAFVFIVLSWVTEGELGSECNPWLFTILWFVVSMSLSGLGFTIIRIML